MNKWFYERYIKETPIEEKIRGQVRAECHYMDKSDIYEWITQDEIKIMNLQSKINKAIKFIEKENKICYTNKTTDDPQKVIGNFMWHTDKLLDILKEAE